MVPGSGKFILPSYLWTIFCDIYETTFGKQPNKYQRLSVKHQAVHVSVKSHLLHKYIKNNLCGNYGSPH